MKYKKARQDMKKIGVGINKQIKIEGVNTKIHKVENAELFNTALSLISD